MTSMWFNGTNINGYMREWQQRMAERDAGIINRDEYFEWKINWPDTCDDCGKHTPLKAWRKAWVIPHNRQAVKMPTDDLSRVIVTQLNR